VSESTVEVVALEARETRDQASVLADILIACVHGGASVSFMAPFSREKAEAFWHDVANAVDRTERCLLVARERNTGRLLGTVQVYLKQPENQPHRGDVAKMLVHPKARRRGLGGELMRAAEEAARAAGKTLLVLDTATGGDAERLYERLGWRRVGIIPDYALWPDGRLCGTTIFYKAL
jgi:ribosomal protein S18 acetylase RimI-like enzyme